MKAGLNHVIIERIGNDLGAVAGLVSQEWASPHLIQSCLGIVRSVGPLWCGAEELSTLPKRGNFDQTSRAQRITDTSLQYDVPCEVKEGDVVMFVYLANIDEEIQVDNYLIVRYDFLLARLDGEKNIYPLNGFVFLEMQDTDLSGGSLHMDSDIEMDSGVVVAEGCQVSKYLYWPSSPGDSAATLLGKRVYFKRMMAVRMEHDAYRLLFGETKYPLYYISRIHIYAYE